MDYLILKLSDKDKKVPFNSEKKLIERANGSWRITPAKLGDIDKALLLFRGQVLEEYEIGDIITFDRKNNRITFDMKVIKNSKYKGKILEYKTANPASIISKAKLNRVLM